MEDKKSIQHHCKPNKIYNIFQIGTTRTVNDASYYYAKHKKGYWRFGTYKDRLKGLYCEPFWPRRACKNKTDLNHMRERMIFEVIIKIQKAFILIVHQQAQPTAQTCQSEKETKYTAAKDMY
jgi:hypothetical protein